MKNAPQNFGEFMTIRKLPGTNTPTETNAPMDETLRQFLGYHMKRAYNILRSDLSKTLEPLGLRITTYSTLTIIIDHPGIRQSNLAAALSIERPNMVLILDDLEQNGWINRERVPTDRRAYALTATLAGRRICEKAVALNQEHEARLLDGIETEEVEKLITALNKIKIAAGD